MEYPFKDLLPLDEVLAREGYYKDWTHLDPKTFYSIVQISEMIKTKGYGTDVRLLISQLAEHFGLSVVEVTDIANGLIARQSTVENRQDAVEDFNTQVIQEMTDKDVISAPELIESRDGEAKLSARLNRDKQELTEQLNEISVSVKRFGAKGDGITDDTVAIQAAINYCHLIGGYLFFPIGTYKVSETLIYKPNMRAFMGRDMSAVSILYVGAVGTYAIKSEYETNTTGGATHRQLGGFRIILPTSKDRSGIDFTRMRYCTAENIRIDHGLEGVRFDNSWGTKLTNMKIFFCVLGANFRDNSNSVQFFKSQFEGNGTAAILQGSAIGFMDGCLFELNTVVFQVRLIYQAVIRDCYFDKNVTLVSWVTGESLKLDFDSCYITNDLVDSVFKVDTVVNNSAHLSVKNCTFQSPVAKAIVDYISGNFFLTWENNYFRTPSVITNYVRYDRIKSDSVSINLNLVNGWTVANGMTPKMTLGLDGYVTLSGAIVGGTNAVICNNSPFYLRPAQNIKYKVSAGSSALGGDYELQVRATEEIRLYGDLADPSKVIYLSGRWKANGQ